MFCCCRCQARYHHHQIPESASLSDLESSSSSFSSSDKPLKEQLEAYLNEFKQKHTKIKITASVETPDPNISYHPVFNINFMRLIAIFFDNIALHANASNVSVQASLTPNMAEVILTDDKDQESCKEHDIG